MEARLGMIGVGNMGQAILRGAIEAGLLTPDEVIAVDVDGRRRDEAAALGCRVSADPAEVVGATQCILAVKPQYFADVAAALRPLPSSRVVISIMAGLSSLSIRRALGDEARVVRVMPNTPCQVGAGMSAIALGAGASPGDEAFAASILGAIGRTVVVDESMMHAVTAVSGSGPAYVFLLAEAMTQAGEELGLDPAVARLLVQQTILGAGRLLVESDGDPSILRQAVTSRGGTTEAAIETMLDGELPQIVMKGVRAARDRGAALDRA
ncbi:MAG: pyrroline-5-carboxylate reductase [Phycisphaerales bacterium]|nr:pyrroline-5-carboxylate reductase [Phycisphaerales bacterium]